MVLGQVLDDLGHPVLASAAYNAGPRRAAGWCDDKPLEGAIYVESIPFRETRNYVKNVMTNTVFYAALLGQPYIPLKERLGTIPARGAEQVDDVPAPPVPPGREAYPEVQAPRTDRHAPSSSQGRGTGDAGGTARRAAERRAGG